MKAFGIALALILFTAPAGFARPVAAEMAIMPLPEPPAYNPHPPQSPEERRRVDFAVQEIVAYYGPRVEIRHPHVIPWSWHKFQNYRKNPPPLPTDKSDPQVIIEAQSAKMEPLPPAQDMVRAAPPERPAPQLKADEFMVHAYVRFPNDPRWHHLDVILSEDGSGHLTRRNFFSIPIPTDPGQLPHGVVC